MQDNGCRVAVIFDVQNDFPNVVNEDKTGEMVLITIYHMKDIGDKYEITGYRNDKSTG